MKEKPKAKDGEQKDKEDSLGSSIKSVNTLRKRVRVHLTLVRLNYV